MSIDVSDAKLLIIEDNPGYRDILIKRLSTKGYKYIEYASNLEKAYECLDKSYYDVCIVDMRLGDDAEGGFRVLERMESNNITSVTIILTANDTVVDCRRAFKTEHCCDYICKNGGESGSPIDEVDKTIQKHFAYLDRWGNRHDKEWLKKNLEVLRKEYPNKYVAVMNNQVIESADSKQEIDEKVKIRRLPNFIPVIQKIPGELRVFYSYAHKDEALRDEVNKCLTILKRQKLITDWHDRNINVGEEWKHEIHTELARADIILLLISFNFIASDYCYELELTQALKRHNDLHDMVTIIPVFLTNVDVENLPFGHIQGCLKDKALNKYYLENDIDEGLSIIQKQIHKTIKQLRQQHEAAFHKKD